MDYLVFERELGSRLQFVPGLPILVLVGARRTGKTTLIRNWYARAEGHKAWLDGDNPADLLAWERFLGGQDPASWLGSLLGLDAKGCGILVLDEAQGFSQVSRLVKVLVDALPGLRVVMSGSSALKLKDFSAESMAGRKQLLELYPLSLKERLSPLTPSLRASSAPGMLQEMLVWGGFPGAMALPPDWSRVSYLTEVLDSTLYRDLLSETRSRDVAVLKRLLVYLARSVGSKLNTANLSASLELNRATVSRYLHLLSEASVLLLLPGITGQGILPKAQPKPYFLDNGLLSMLLADDRSFLMRRPEEQGLLLENFFVAELHKSYHYQGDHLTQLGYLWDKRAEIDLVAYSRGAIQAAWEVKLSQTQGGSRHSRELLGSAPFRLVNLQNMPEFLL
ncbi:ATP-binding protein [bacterium]|nr:ATP-binding protein [bacterium]